MGFASDFDFEGIKPHFRLNGNLLNRAAAKRLVAPLAKTEYLPVYRCGTISETSEDPADDLERRFEFLRDNGVGAGVIQLLDLRNIARARDDIRCSVDTPGGRDRHARGDRI